MHQPLFENLKFRNKVNLRKENMTSRSAYKYRGQHAINRSDSQIKDSYCKPMKY